MNEKQFQKNVIEMAVVNTDHLSFVKSGSTQDGSFTVSIFRKDEGYEQYGILFFAREPQPNAMFFKNVVYDQMGDTYYDEVELYKQHISQVSGVDFTGKNGMGFIAKMNVDIDVQGFTSKQEVDENGNPVFNDDGTPKMVNKPFNAKGKMN
jgi:hypothetical protein